MLYKNKDSQEFSIPGGTKGYLYPAHPQKEQQVALVEMDGVYPQKGYSKNDYCTETLFVISGSIDLEVNGKKYDLEPNDLFMILPGQKYKSKGKAVILDLISPSWDKKQNHIVKK